MKDKLRAFLVHLAVSLLIALGCLTVVYGVWYPAPLHKATGITHIFLLMVGIDLILGPLLTLIVYKKHKRTLKFDLAVIIALQLGALVYGMMQVAQGRPAWIAYNVDRFDLVRVNEIDTRKLQQAEPAYQSASLTGPQYVAAVLPKDDIEQNNQILFDEIGSGISPSQRPELYQALTDVYPEIVKRALPLEQLDHFNDPQQVKTVLAEFANADSFVPLKANAQDMTVLIDKKSGGKVVKIVDLRPWQ